MKKHTQLTITILGAFLIGSVLIGINNYFKKTKQTEPESRTAKQQVTPLPVQPTQEQLDLFEGFLFPALDKASRDYPIIVIRQRLADLFERASRGEVRFVVSPTPAIAQEALAGHEYINGQHVITIWAPRALIVSKRYPDRELFLDKMIETILHECFHAFHQPLVEGRELYTTRLKHESEAWWDNIEHVIFPMQQAGRLQKVDTAIQMGIAAHRTAKGNPNHPAWVKFIRRVTPTDDQTGQ